jgi:peptide/nickel transport system ATP-binding protein/oligopeptide transport system ATP-binding protein
MLPMRIRAVPGSEPLLQARGLVKSFAEWSTAIGGRSGRRIAVDEVSLDIAAGDALGIVGESGSGKSTLARMIAGLVRPDAGTVRVDGVDPARRAGGLRREAARSVQMVFQDPYSSLNPRLRIVDSVMEPLLSAAALPRAAARPRALEMLAQVGIPDSVKDRYPHEFSGGQRQRICIARALALRPQLVILDEAVSALDVSVKSQILNLLHDLRERLGATFIFISHDLAITRQISDRIAVMLQGRVVEIGPGDLILKAPVHPYTRLLLQSIPRRHGGLRLDLPRLAAAGPGSEEGSGCKFVARCPAALGVCRSQRPPLRRDDSGREVACHAAAR